MPNRRMGAGEIMEPMENGPQGQAPGISGEGAATEGANEAMQGQLEDMIINDFISEDLAFTTFMNEIDNSIPYNSLNEDKRDTYDQKAFNFYNDKYVNEIVNNDSSANITLENFILMHNPSLEFRSDLTDFSLGSKNTFATDWEKIYKSDLELHKKSAIKGYQAAILAEGATGL